MESFSLAIKVFTFFILIFFGVFAYTCLLWTNRDPKKIKNIMTGVMVSLIYTFQAVIWGTLFFVIAYLISFYLEHYS